MLKIFLKTTDNLKHYNIFLMLISLFVRSLFKQWIVLFSKDATVCANKPWSSRYIISIHKNNDITDPNNYRGITVANAIG